MTPIPTWLMNPMAARTPSAGSTTPATCEPRDLSQPCATRRILARVALRRRHASDTAPAIEAERALACRRCSVRMPMGSSAASSAIATPKITGWVVARPR